MFLTSVESSGCMECECKKSREVGKTGSPKVRKEIQIQVGELGSREVENTSRDRKTGRPRVRKSGSPEDRKKIQIKVRELGSKEVRELERRVGLKFN